MVFTLACFVVVRATWISFAVGVRELRRATLSMLETHIMMSFLICHLILILVFRLARTLVLYLSSLMDLTITHMVLVHERTALFLYALDTTHILIVVIISRVGTVFLLESDTHFEPRQLNNPHFLRRCSRPTQPNSELQRIMKTSSYCMVK
jgi:hypothetical protein